MWKYSRLAFERAQNILWNDLSITLDFKGFKSSCWGRRNIIYECKKNRKNQLCQNSFNNLKSSCCIAFTNRIHFLEMAKYDHLFFPKKKAFTQQTSSILVTQWTIQKFYSIPKIIIIGNLIISIHRASSAKKLLSKNVLKFVFFHEWKNKSRREEEKSPWNGVWQDYIYRNWYKISFSYGERILGKLSG